MSYQINRMQIGIVGYYPGLVLLSTKDTLEKITEPGYLDGNQVGLTVSDILFVSYGEGKTGIFSISDDSGIIVISPTTGGQSIPIISVVGPANVTALKEWDNALISVSGTGPVVITLPDDVLAGITEGYQFFAVQVSAASTFGYAVQGADNLYQNLATSSNVGDSSFLKKIGPSSWSSSYVTQATGGGSVNLLSNLPGDGQGVYAQQIGGDAQLKRISNTDGNIEITADSNQVYLNIPEIVKDGESLGTGVDIYAGKVGDLLSFKSMKAGAGVTITEPVSGEVLVSATGGTGDITDANNVGSGVGIFKNKTGSALNFRSLIGGSFISLDSSNPDQVVINGTGSASFDYENVYFMAFNGSNAFSGKSIDQPKQTLTGASGVIASITNPSANNVLYILDGATYSQTGNVNIPANMRLSILGPEATISSSSLTDDIFYLNGNSYLEIKCKSLQTNVSNLVVQTIGAGAAFNITCDTIVGRVGNASDTPCVLFCNISMTGDIATGNTNGITGYVRNHVGATIGKFTNIPGVLPSIRYSSSQIINIDNSFIGGQIVTDSSSTGDYTVNLPNFTSTYIPEGSYFRVIQAGNDKVVFAPTGGSVLDSDQDAGAADKTQFKGANIYVCVSYIGTVTHWSISGKLTT